jgi:hypothetical protein
MASMEWLEPLVNSAEDGTALTNSTTATNILPGARAFTLPSYAYKSIGQTLKLRAAGRISTLVTTPGTLTLDVRFVNGSGIVVFNGGAMTLNTTAQTNMNWLLELDLVVRSIGSGTAATLLGQGYFKSHAVIGSPAPTAGGAGAHLLPYNANPGAGTGFDSTLSQQIALFATWSVANAANSIQNTQLSVISVN